MIDIQVVFQGGGAKILSLVAALEALQDLENTGEVKITRVAGTSAGAIVAALHAFGVRIKELDSSQVQSVVKLLSDCKELSSIADDSWTQNGKKLFKIYMGESLLPDDLLRNALNELLSSLHLSEDLKLEDAETPLLVATTSISEEHAIYLYSEGYEKDKPLIDALVASCNIPLLFSSFKGVGDWRHAFVDGGLCENLPVEPLHNERASFGPVVAISLRAGEKTYPPTTAKQYLLQLADIAINNSVERAKRILGQENVLTLRCDLSTLDFSGEIEKLRGSNVFKAARKTSEEWMREHFKNLQRDKEKDGKIVESEPGSRTLMIQNWRSYINRAQNYKCRLDYSALFAIPRSWSGPTAMTSSDWDSLLRAHRIPRQPDFRLQEFPLGLTQIGKSGSTPPKMIVHKITKANERLVPIDFEISRMLQEEYVGGELKHVDRFLVTLKEPLELSGSDISDDDAEAILIRYEQRTPLLFDELEDPAKGYDVLGMRIGGLTTQGVDNVYLVIFGDPALARVTVEQEGGSVPLETIENEAYMPKELATMAEWGGSFVAKRANMVAGNQVARLKLTRRT